MTLTCLLAVSSLHLAIIQQSLAFFCAVFSVQKCCAARYPGQQGAVQSIVECRAHQQDQETKHLQALKMLPSQCEAHSPDDQSAQTVKYHPCGGTDLFSDTDPSKVEEGYADGIAQQGQQDEGFVADLTESIQRILQDLTRVVGEVAHRNEVHRDEEKRQYDKPKKALKWKTEFCMTNNGSSWLF